MEDMSEPSNNVARNTSWKLAIENTLSSIRDGMLRHHQKWGSSIFQPVTILSSIGAEDAIRLRIDDRLRKLTKCRSESEERELIDDLIGYLINLRAFNSIHKPDVWRDFE